MTDEQKPPDEQNPLVQKKETAVNPFLKFPPEKFNQLSPTITFLDHIGPWHQISVDVVKVSADPNDGDVYLQQKGWPERNIPDRWSPAKPMLLKFADAAAISFHPELTGSVVVEDLRVISKAVAIMKQNDGQFRTITAEYELDLSVVEHETRADYSRKADEKIRKQDGRLTMADREKWIDDKTSELMLKKRKHKVAFANTGAMLRAIRMMLAIKSTYTTDELLKPFAIPRVDFRPPLDDPDVKRALLAKMSTSRDRVFGAGMETFDAGTGEIIPDDQPVIGSGTPPDADPADGQVVDATPADTNETERRTALAGALGLDAGSEPDPQPAPKSNVEIFRDRVREIHSLYDDEQAKRHLIDRMIETGYDKHDPRDPAGILDPTTGKTLADKIVDLELWIFMNVPESALNLQQTDMFGGDTNVRT